MRLFFLVSMSNFFWGVVKACRKTSSQHDLVASPDLHELRSVRWSIYHCKMVADNVLRTWTWMETVGIQLVCNSCPVGPTFFGRKGCCCSHFFCMKSLPIQDEVVCTYVCRCNRIHSKPKWLLWKLHLNMIDMNTSPLHLTGHLRCKRQRLLPEYSVWLCLGWHGLRPSN